MASASGKSRNEPRLESYAFPKWKEAPMTPMRHAELSRAAAAFAERHPSDPFTFGRIFLYMKRGIVSPAEVLADARGVVVAE